MIEVQAGGAAQTQTEAGLQTRPAGDTQVCNRAGAGQVFGLAKLQRPKGHVVGGAVFAGGLLPFADLAAQLRPAGYQNALLQRCFVQVRHQLNDRHGGHRREEVRENHFQKMLRKARKLRIHFQLHAGR